MIAKMVYFQHLQTVNYPVELLLLNKKDNHQKMVKI